jgi:hypothetical protein
VIKYFGDPPADVFANVKQHLMLQLLAGMFSPRQLSMCSAVICGGHLELSVREPEVDRMQTPQSCAVVGCPELHASADHYCHNHRPEAAAALLETAVVAGGEALKVSCKLERAGAEALAPYIRANHMLLSLDLSGAMLGPSGMQLLAEAFLPDTLLAHLDVSANGLVDGGGIEKYNGVDSLCRLVRMSR